MLSCVWTSVRDDKRGPQRRSTATGKTPGAGGQAREEKSALHAGKDSSSAQGQMRKVRPKKRVDVRLPERQ